MAVFPSPLIPTFPLSLSLDDERRQAICLVLCSCHHASLSAHAWTSKNSSAARCALWRAAQPEVEPCLPWLIAPYNYRADSIPPGTAAASLVEPAQFYFHQGQARAFLRAGTKMTAAGATSQTAVPAAPEEGVNAEKGAVARESETFASESRSASTVSTKLVCAAAAAKPQSTAASATAAKGPATLFVAQTSVVLSAAAAFAASASGRKPGQPIPRDESDGVLGRC